jgi:hypothetical protein
MNWRSPVPLREVLDLGYILEFYYNTQANKSCESGNTRSAEMTLMASMGDDPVGTTKFLVAENKNLYLYSFRVY